MLPLSADQEELRSLFEGVGYVTQCPSMFSVLQLAQKAARVSDLSILIEGETGTGKQVLASAIHKLDGKRSAFPFVTVHCGTITEALAESELFGHQKGAFSGATSDRRGLFQAASHGTLFLDDVNDLSPALQVKLLDALQRKVVRPVGSDTEVPVNTRVIAASNQPLGALVEKNCFRADLYYRLNVVRLPLPPLRERTQDLACLILVFSARNRHIYPSITSVETELLHFLATQPLAGNIRELEHAVERMLFAKNEGTSLGMSDWASQSREPMSRPDKDAFREAATVLWNAIVQSGLTLNQAMQRLEGTMLETAVRSGTHTRREIALCLKTSERTLYHRLRSHRLVKGD